MDEVMKCINTKVKVFTCKGTSDRYIEYLSEYFNCEQKIKHTLIFNGVEETCMYVAPKDYYKAVTIGCNYLSLQGIKEVGVVSPLGEVSYNVRQIKNVNNADNSRYIQKLLKGSKLLCEENPDLVKDIVDTPKTSEEQIAEDFVENYLNKQ